MDSEHSRDWHRICDLRPRLRPHVRAHRHDYRGTRWYVLQDGASTRHYRFGAGVQRVLALMNGERTVTQIYDSLTATETDETPTRQQVSDMLTTLHSSDLLQTDSAPDPAELTARGLRTERSKRLRAWRSPFVIRLGLFDPHALLTRCLPLARLLFSPLGGVLWLLAVAVAGVTVIGDWTAITGYWSERALAPYNLALLFLVYPLVKGVHELAHGLAVRRWGGEVHETGVMLLVFMPLPFVDASSASAFSDKRHRMTVSAAGILAELFLAAVAALVWTTVETGLVRDIAFNVMIIGGLSTVIFNGNPLLRFDGYYLLADAIEIPNLAQRSTGYLGYLAQRYLLGIPQALSPVTARGERRWFVCYGIAAFAYRMTVLTAIVLFVSERFRAAGVAMAVLAVSTQVMLPLLKQLRFVAASPALQRRRFRAVGVVTGVTGGIALALLLVPMPSWTLAEGVVWAPPGSQLRAGTDGFVTTLLVEQGAAVNRGEPVLTVSDPLLEARVKATEWELKSLQAKYDALAVRSPGEAAVVARQLQSTADDLDQLRQQSARLTVHSPGDGVFTIPGARHLEGRYVTKGKLIGYVTEARSPVIHAVVPQRHAGQVRGDIRRVKIRLADDPGETLPAQVRREVPSASNRLPSAALGTLGGGVVTLDAKDREGHTSAESVFTVELGIPGDYTTPRVGTRVYVRFEHTPRPLAQQWYRSLRQLLLRRLQV